MPGNRSGSARLRRSAERGFSLVSAIFLLVVLAGLAAAMVNVSIMQHTSSALDVQGTRSYHAARAGIEWGIYRTIVQNAGACPASPTSFAPAAPMLRAFTVTVDCTTGMFNNANPPIVWRQITATACNQPAAAEPRCPNPNAGTDYVQRVVQVTF